MQNEIFAVWEAQKNRIQLELFKTYGVWTRSPVAYYLTLVANLSIIMLESKLLYLVTLETLRMCPNLITQLLVATTTC